MLAEGEEKGTFNTTKKSDGVSGEDYNIGRHNLPNREGCLECIVQHSQFFLEMCRNVATCFLYNIVAFNTIISSLFSFSCDYYCRRSWADCRSYFLNIPTASLIALPFFLYAYKSSSKSINVNYVCVSIYSYILISCDNFHQTSSHASTAVYRHWTLKLVSQQHFIFISELPIL